MRSWTLLLTLGLSTTAGASSYALQPPGTFHGDEPIARSGQAWLALRQQGETAALVPTRLRVRAVRDDVLDRDDETTGREVSSPVDDALLFLRGENLRAGPVATAGVSRTSEPPALPSYTLNFHDRTYRIRTLCAPSAEPNTEQQQYECELWLEYNGLAQRLFAMSGYAPTGGSPAVILGDEANAHLIFAGDLDRDGRLDLIFDGSHHYNVSLPTLFLSSQAASDELVHQVAQYESVGC